MGGVNCVAERSCCGCWVVGVEGRAGIGEVEGANSEGEGTGGERFDGVDGGEVFSYAADLAREVGFCRLTELSAGREVRLCRCERGFGFLLRRFA